MRAARPLVPLAALALLLGACTPDARPAADGDREDERIKVAQPVPDEEPEPSTGDPQEPGEPDAGLAACILGQWEADLASVESMTRATMEMAGTDLEAEVTASGRAVTTIADGSLVSEYQDWAATVVMTMAGTEIRTESVQQGRTTQTYTLEGDLLHVGPIDMTDSTMEMHQYINGVEQDTSAYQQGFEMGLSANRGGTSRVVCTADTMTLTPVLAGEELTEMTASFTRL